jgi:hypothetical protein
MLFRARRPDVDQYAAVPLYEIGKDSEAEVSDRLCVYIHLFFNYFNRNIDRAFEHGRAGVVYQQADSFVGRDGLDRFAYSSRS